ncbi:MAG: hypothetical protein V1748_01475 [Actinomycetota bacterium]
MRATIRRTFSVVLVVSLLALLLVAGTARADTWTQSAAGGMDGTYNQLQTISSSSAWFTDGTGISCLFVGTRTPDGTGCEVWRYDPTVPAWTQVNADGFGDSDNVEASSMAVFSHGGTTYLYVGTENSVTGCELWRTAGLGGPPYTDWVQVNVDGWGAALNTRVSSLADFGGAWLYAGTANVSGCQIWGSIGVGGPPYADWVMIGAPGIANPANVEASSMLVFPTNGWLHVGTSSAGGCEVYAFQAPGPVGPWVRVDAPPGGPPPPYPGGFGTPLNLQAASMALYSHGAVNYLYVGTENWQTGFEVWRTAGLVGPFGNYADWTLVGSAAIVGVGQVHIEASSMVDFGGFLHVGTTTDPNVVPGPGSQLFNTQGLGGPPYVWNNVTGNMLRPDISSFSTLSVPPGGGSLYIGTANSYCGTQVYLTLVVGGLYNQVNDNGFAYNNLEAAGPLVEYAGDLYAGSQNDTRGCRVSVFDGTAWSQSNSDGFGAPAPNPVNKVTTSMAVARPTGADRLYAGTFNQWGGCQVYDFDGATWNQVDGGVFGANNVAATSMAACNFSGTDYLFVGTANNTGGAEVWRFDGALWAQVDPNTAPWINNIDASSMAVYNGLLYVGTQNNATGCEVWSYDGTNWVQVQAGGLGDSNNTRIPSMVEGGGFLHLGSMNASTGCQVWRFDGVGWTKTNATDGFGDNNQIASSLAFFNGGLYVASGNNTNGAKVWRSGLIGGPPYTDWAQVNTNGFGSPNNTLAVSLASYGSRLYAGTWNFVNGCEIWRVNAPVVSGANPASGLQGRTLNVQIAGSDSHFVNGVSQATFGGAGITVNSTTVTSPTQATANITISLTATAGPGSVTVNTGGESATLAGAFTVNTAVPTVTGITPATAPKGTTVDITDLAGTNFLAGATVRLKKGGQPDIVATNVTVSSLTKITCRFAIPVTAATGDWDVYVENANGQGGTLTAGFNVAPTVSDTWYLAEGTTDWGFGTYISIENPNATTVTCEITYMPTGGDNEVQTVTLPGLSRLTVDPGEMLGSRDFSTKVKCKEGMTIAVDRTMEWLGEGATCPERHCSIGVPAPATDWFLPEGSSDWGFECWLLIQNPNGTQADCDITYMIEGADPVTVTKTVPANSRATFNMDDDIGAQDASIRVESDVPVIPERAMYRNNRREGHDSIGTTAAATSYYLAEGTSAWGFTTYVLIQNPQGTENSVNVTYMTDSGPVPHPENPIVMPANSRKTIRVNDFLPTKDFSTRVDGDKPIIAERAMYWDNGTGEACHDSIGMSAPHNTFFLPDGCVGSDVETWTLVQNPNDSDVDITVTYLSGTGADPITFTDEVPANSRKTFNMADKGVTGQAGIMVTCDTPAKNIMVERAMYWYDRGAGTDTIGGYAD